MVAEIKQGHSEAPLLSEPEFSPSQPRSRLARAIKAAMGVHVRVRHGGLQRELLSRLPSLPLPFKLPTFNLPPVHVEVGQLKVHADRISLLEVTININNGGVK